MPYKFLQVYIFIEYQWCPGLHDSETVFVVIKFHWEVVNVYLWRWGVRGGKIWFFGKLYNPDSDLVLVSLQRLDFVQTAALLDQEGNLENKIN